MIVQSLGMCWFPVNRVGKWVVGFCGKDFEEWESVVNIGFDGEYYVGLDVVEAVKEDNESVRTTWPYYYY